jgi:hypothetical protein
LSIVEGVTGFYLKSTLQTIWAAYLLRERLAKYIGLDVHQATISATVLDSTGKLVMETKAATILQFIHGLRGLVARLAQAPCHASVGLWSAEECAAERSVVACSLSQIPNTRGRSMILTVTWSRSARESCKIMLGKLVVALFKNALEVRVVDRAIEFFLTILLGVSLVGFIKAQETARDTAGEVKKEIINLENDKVHAQTECKKSLTQETR